MWYVDLPQYDPSVSPEEEQSYVGIAEFESREEALRFAQEMFAADQDGKISLVTGSDHEFPDIENNYS